MGWLTSVALKFMRVVPLHTLVAVVALLFSQLFQVLAFLLPLKVIILLGSPGTPRYFPAALADLDHDVLIFTLAGAAVVFYLAYLVSESIGAALAERGGIRLLEKSRKLELLNNQRELAISFYQSFALSLSGLVLAFLVSVFLAVFYPLLLALVVVYSASAFWLFALYARFKPSFIVTLANRFSWVVGVLSAVGFLLAFAFLVYDFLYGNAPSLLLVIVALLLCRQMFTRLATTLKGFERLYLHRDRLNALFFHNALVSRGPVPQEASFWQAIEPGLCQAWIKAALVECGFESHSSLVLEYMDAGAKGQVLLRVATLQDGQTTGIFLFKIFSEKNALIARHEALLLHHEPGDGVAPRLLHVSERDGCFAHLFRWDDLEYTPLPKRKLRVCRAQVAAQLLQWRVPVELISLFTRSKSVLHKRLDADFWRRYHSMAYWLGEEARETARGFFDEPDRLGQVLRSLPLCLSNPDIQEGRAFLGSERYVVTYWGGWVLEPLGSGWPIERGLEALAVAFEAAQRTRADLAGLTPTHVQIAALSHEFESLCKRGRYTEGSVLLAQIQSLLESIGA